MSAANYLFSLILWVFYWSYLTGWNLKKSLVTSHIPNPRVTHQIFIWRLKICSPKWFDIPPIVKIFTPTFLVCQYKVQILLIMFLVTLVMNYFLKWIVSSLPLFSSIFYSFTVSLTTLASSNPWSLTILLCTIIILMYIALWIWNLDIYLIRGSEPKFCRDLNRWRNWTILSY